MPCQCNKAISMLFLWYFPGFAKVLCIQTLLPHWPRGCFEITLWWRHNGRDSVSNHQPHDCLLNRLFRRGSKKTSKLRVTGLCAGNSPHKWPVTWKMFLFDDVIMKTSNSLYRAVTSALAMKLLSGECQRTPLKKFSIGSDNALMPSDNKPLLLTMLI